MKSFSYMSISTISFVFHISKFPLKISVCVQPLCITLVLTLAPSCLCKATSCGTAPSKDEGDWQGLCRDTHTEQFLSWILFAFFVCLMSALLSMAGCKD